MGAGRGRDSRRERENLEKMNERRVGTPGEGRQWRGEWQLCRKGEDLVVNVMCYIRFASALTVESSGTKRRVIL